MSRIPTLTPPRKGGLKAPSVHISPSRPPAPPSATGSSSSSTSGIPSAIGRAPRAASLSQLPHGENGNGLRMRTSSGMSRTSQGGNQPQYDDDAHDVSSNDGGLKYSPVRPAPLQRAATTSALPSRPATTFSIPRSLSPLESSTIIGLPSTKTDNIRVVLRIRPPRPSASHGDDGFHGDDAGDGNNQNAFSNQGARSCVDVTPDGTGVIIGPGSMQEKRFMFDRVFGDECNQEDIFQDAGLMAVENTLNGFNGCIFAYGQTGSGKTFTMLGGGEPGGGSSGGQHDVHELKVSPLRGLMPRIFDHLIRRLEDLVADDSNDLQYTLSCSYLEIYNEKVFDLLETGNAIAQPKSLREDSIKKEVYVDQLRQIQIKSAAEAIEWLQLGSRNRRMASTDMNRESSRSHAVFTIRLLQTHHTDRGDLITRRSNLHLVDLAGSEKQRQTKAVGQRLKEAAQINKSLSALGNVIMALVDVSNGLKRHVHYRDSKLTFLLRDSLGGNSITTIIGAISGEEKYFSETLSTLKFAQRAKFIKNKAVQNEDSDAVIPLLKEEIERLRQTIAAMEKARDSAQRSDSSQVSRYDHAEQHPSYNSYSYIPQPPPPPRVNKWEPALEMMDRLLKASGAAAPENPMEEDYEALEVRSQRLEMLLYRMICRFEEQKVVSFSGPSNPRARVPQPPQPTISRAPSMLRKPKIRIKRDENQDDDTRSTSSSTTNTTNNNADLELELNEQVTRNAELGAENELLRNEFVEYFEWKHNPERQQVGDSGITSGHDLQVVLDEQRERYEELLDAYRLLVSNLNLSLQDKRDNGSASRSSTASVSEDQSVSGMSMDDDNESVASDAEFSIELDDTELYAAQRELFRINDVGRKLVHKHEKLQDKIQQLERNLVAAQDEVETATAATKFAEFQLEQFRNAHANQAEMDAELSALRTTNRRVNHENDELKRVLAKAETDLQDALLRVQESDAKHQQLVEQYQHERSEMEAAFAASVKRFEEHRVTQDVELEDLRARVTRPEIEGVGDDGDAALIAELHHRRQLDEEMERNRASSILSTGGMLGDPRSRAQSTPAFMHTKSADPEDEQTSQELLKSLVSDNADLLKTIRELQVEKQSREQEHLREIQRLRDDSEGLRARLTEMRQLAVGSISATTHSKQKAETDQLISRLRSERDAFRNKYKLSHQQVTNLEDQLSRSQSVNAARTSIPSMYEM